MPEKFWHRGFLLSAALGILLFVACETVGEEAAEDRKIARVQNHFLMASDLEGLIVDEVSPEDSALVANAYVERWVREQVMMTQAEKNIPKDLNIDELVRDYRASLVRYHYEKLIVEVELDSTITESEIMANYNEREEEFWLKEPYYNYYFLAFTEEDTNMSKVDNWWKKSADSIQWQLLSNFAVEEANAFAIGEEEWISSTGMKAMLPDGFNMNRLRAGRKYEVSEDGIKYFLEIKEILEKGSKAPISTVEDQIKKVILHRRKIELLESKIEETYERESELNHVQIFK